MSAQPQSLASASKAPLVVDLDGTLTFTDTLIESVLQLVRHRPLSLLRLPFQLLKGRAAFKAFVARQSSIAVGQLPYRTELLEYLRQEKAQGRRLILATAAHNDIARGVAAHLQIFEQVLASDETRNLKGPAKLNAIQESVGPHFVYAGDTSSDIPIWEAADAAILVGLPASIAATVRRTRPIEREFERRPAGLRTWLRAIRVHQWLKNLLLFVPLLTAFSFLERDKLVAGAVGFMAFCLAASATYIANDLWDIENDRAHARKRERPFAAGSIPILHGVAVAIGLLAIALGLAGSVSQGFLVALLVYIVSTTAYSWVLKEYVLIDVLMLSMLYTLRILAGAIAVRTPPSSWLLAFSVFIFFSLALVKRCSELVSLTQSGKPSTRGRDYRVTDLTVLWPLGVGAALSAVVVFGLFIDSPDTKSRYGSPQLLWLVAAGLIYWLARLWIKTARGEMHDDPIVFAVRDFGSRVTVFAMVVVTLVAHFISVELP